MQRLTLSEQAVLNCLFRDAKKGIASASQSDIARRTNQSPRNVKRAIKALIDVGALVLIKRGDSFRGCSVYRVIPDPSNW